MARPIPADSSIRGRWIARKNQAAGVARPIPLSLRQSLPLAVPDQACRSAAGRGVEQAEAIEYAEPQHVQRGDEEMDYNGKGSTKFNFPDYTPITGGTITWTATIADVDPDIDLATATTLVR